MKPDVKRLVRMIEILADASNFTNTTDHCPKNVICVNRPFDCTNCRIRAAFDAVEKEKEK